MRIIKIKTLRAFWKQYPNAETGLKVWYKRITSRRWESPHEIKAAFADASIVGNNRIVFNINRNDYRLIVKFEYGKVQQGYIRFVNTHEEYDKIKDISTI